MIKLLQLTVFVVGATATCIGSDNNKQPTNVSMRSPLYELLMNNSSHSNPMSLANSIKFLVNRGESVNEKEFPGGKTGLMVLTETRKPVLFYAALQGPYSIDYDVKDDNGNTLRQYVCRYGTPEMIRRIYDYSD